VRTTLNQRPLRFDATADNILLNRYNCDKIPECKKNDEQITCETCLEKIKDKIGYAFSASGGVGLFFSFTEVR
jgi:hypothetical protein